MRNINDRREAAATRIQRLQRHRQQQRQQREQHDPGDDDHDDGDTDGATTEGDTGGGGGGNDDHHPPAGAAAGAELDPSMRRSIDTLRTSISDIREELIQQSGGGSSGPEPLVRLRRSVQGSDSNVVSVEQGHGQQGGGGGGRQSSNVIDDANPVPHRVRLLC